MVKRGLRWALYFTGGYDKLFFCSVPVNLLTHCKRFLQMLLAKLKTGKERWFEGYTAPQDPLHEGNDDVSNRYLLCHCDYLYHEPSLLKAPVAANPFVHRVQTVTSMWQIVADIMSFLNIQCGRLHVPIITVREVNRTSENCLGLSFSS